MRSRRLPRLDGIVAAAALALLSCGPAQAQALSLRDAFSAAQGFDAQYLAASHELASARQGLPIARSALLPQIVFSASGANVTGTRQFPNASNQDVTVPVDYYAPQASLSLRAPIFNYDAISRYRQAGAQVSGAEAQFLARGLEMTDRLATAYMQALLSNENVSLAETQVKSLVSQKDRAEQRFRRGEGTRIDVAQAVSSLDVARVQLIEAQDSLQVAVRTLQRLTGVTTTELRQPSTDFEPPPIEPQGMQDWLELARRQNPTIQAREQAVVAARMGVDRNMSGHLPRLDLVASVGRSRNESLANLNQSSALKSIGVQLSVPIYSGGGVDASVKQALSDQARVEQEARSDREAIEIEVQRQYQAVVNGSNKLAAYQRVVTSNTVLLEGVTRGADAGMSTFVDVLDAQSKLYQAKRDLAQTRAEYLLARLRLMTQAGVPMADVIQEIDRHLSQPSPLKMRSTS